MPPPILGVDANFIKKRIEILRACFRKVWRKVKLSKESESSADDVRIPKLWYFDKLMFLAEQEMARDSELNCTEETNLDEPSQEKGREVESDFNGEPVVSDAEPADLGSQFSRKRKREEKRTPGPRRKQSRNSESIHNLSFLKLIRAIDKNRDEYDAVGENVGAKLRRMEERQRIHAERLINEVLFRGLLEQLSERTSVLNENTVLLRHESPTPSNATSCFQVEKNGEDFHFEETLTNLKKEPGNLEFENPLSS